MAFLLRPADQTVTQSRPGAIEIQRRGFGQAVAIDDQTQQVAIIAPDLQCLTDRAVRGAQPTQGQVTFDPVDEPLPVCFLRAGPGLGDQPVLRLEFTPLLCQTGKHCRSAD